MSGPEFVTVGPSGVPVGHENAADAVAAHLANIGGEWCESIFPGLREEIEEGLRRDLRHDYFFHQPHGSPRLATIRRTMGQPVEDYRNAHLWQRPESLSYLLTATHAWAARSGPRVGDYIRLADGSESRLTYDWGDGFQAGGGGGSFHVFRGGIASYSGGLSGPIPRARIKDTGESKDGEFWFFLDGFTGAHRGISCQIPCRVYQEESGE